MIDDLFIVCSLSAYALSVAADIALSIALGSRG
jgi:hypothetical protein